MLPFQAKSNIRPIILTYQLKDDPLIEDIAGIFPTLSGICKPEIQIEADPAGSFEVSSIIKQNDYILEISTNKKYSSPLTFIVTGTYMKNDPSVMQSKY